MLSFIKDFLSTFRIGQDGNLAYVPYYSLADFTTKHSPVIRSHSGIQINPPNPPASAFGAPSKQEVAQLTLDTLRIFQAAYTTYDTFCRNCSLKNEFTWKTGPETNKKNTDKINPIFVSTEVVDANTVEAKIDFTEKKKLNFVPVRFEDQNTDETFVAFVDIDSGIVCLNLQETTLPIIKKGDELTLVGIWNNEIKSYDEPTDEAVVYASRFNIDTSTF
jgi:hypothetical protein